MSSLLVQLSFCFPVPFSLLGWKVALFFLFSVCTACLFVRPCNPQFQLLFPLPKDKVYKFIQTILQMIILQVG